ncbi:MAG: SDR family NAD(P)-dependent oxidoreductase [Gemmatimonadota bacterium]
MRIGPETVAVVTGGADGIGRALVEQLLRREAQAVAIDNDRNGLRSLLEALPRASGHLCDVSDPGSVASAAAFIQDRFGRVDLLVNNAGTSVAGHVEESPIEDLQHVIAVNFWGVVHSCRAFLPLLRASASGSDAAICNVLSDFALIGVPGKSGYAASKYAARALTETLGAELQGSGVSVLAAYPGATATGLIRRGRAVNPAKQTAEADYLSKGMRPDFVARRILHGIERGRTRLLIGLDARVIDLAIRFAPGPTLSAIRRFWRRVPFL